MKQKQKTLKTDHRRVKNSERKKIDYTLKFISPVEINLNGKLINSKRQGLFKHIYCAILHYFFIFNNMQFFISIDFRRKHTHAHANFISIVKKMINFFSLYCFFEGFLLLNVTWKLVRLLIVAWMHNHSQAHNCSRSWVSRTVLLIPLTFIQL